MKILCEITSDDINEANLVRPLNPLEIHLLKRKELGIHSVITLPKQRCLWVNITTLYKIPKLGQDFLQRYNSFQPTPPITFQLLQLC